MRGVHYGDGRDFESVEKYYGKELVERLSVLDSPFEYANITDVVADCVEVINQLESRAN